MEQKRNEKTLPQSPSLNLTTRLSMPSQKSPDRPMSPLSKHSDVTSSIQINDRIFAFNEDGQTYFADPDAGTYRELVVAAENCQVTIIHPPGKARNPYEPGFQDFIKRAEAFQ
jgi:hypothetical protein